MKKFLFLMIVAALFVTSLAGCAASGSSGVAPTTSGPILLTVKGKIAAGTYALDQGAFEKNSKEGAYFDPWVGKSGKDVTAKGILLKDLINLVKPTSDAKTISLIAKDGKAFDVPIADAQQYNIMIDHWIDGAELVEKTGGPVKVAYPKEATAYKPEQWAWWLVTVEFK